MRPSKFVRSLGKWYADLVPIHGRSADDSPRIAYTLCNHGRIRQHSMTDGQIKALCNNIDDLVGRVKIYYNLRIGS